VLISVILVGCKGDIENQANKTVSDADLQGIKQGVENNPCLINIGGLAACDTATIGQRRMVLIRGEVLSMEE